MNMHQEAISLKSLFDRALVERAAVRRPAFTGVLALELVVVSIWAGPVWARPIVNEHQKLTGDIQSNDNFGYSVAVAGDWAVVTTDRLDAESFVFRRDGNGTPNDPKDDVWIEHGTIVGIDPETGPVGVATVTMNEDRIVLGAYANPMSHRVGFVFARDDNGTPDDPADDLWLQQAMLEASVSATPPLDVHSVSMFGDRILAGTTATGLRKGRAYVFRMDDNGTPGDETDDFWLQETTLEPPELEPSDRFGASVALAADWAVVGAEGDDDAGNIAGAVYLFRRNDNATPADPSDDSWIQHAKLLPPDGSDLTVLGIGVAITASGDRVVSGAPGYDGPANNSGAAYVFRRDDVGTPADLGDDLWTQEALLAPAGAIAGTFVGNSVTIHDDRILVGATGPTCVGGFAFLFQLCDGGTPADPSDDSWAEAATLLASDASEGQAFGAVVAFDGPWMIVGAPTQEAMGVEVGAAYMFLLEQQDCNANGTPDACEPDCNANGLADDCDLAPGGGSVDINGDGVPDDCLSAPMNEDSIGMPCLPGCNAFTECENTAVCMPGQDGSFPGTCYVPKNRYVSAAPNSRNVGVVTARRVSVLTTGGAVVLGWVGAPDPASGLQNALISRVSETPVFRDWNLDGTIHLGDCHTSPGWTYLIESTVDGVTFSQPLTLSTVDDWGDVIGSVVGGAATAPEGATNLEDVLQIVMGFQGISAAPKVWLDLGPLNPNGVVNISDVQQAVVGFQGGDFLALPGAMDPCECAGLGPCG